MHDAINNARCDQQCAFLIGRILCWPCLYIFIFLKNIVSMFEVGTFFRNVNTQNVGLIRSRGYFLNVIVLLRPNNGNVIYFYDEHFKAILHETDLEATDTIYVSNIHIKPGITCIEGNCIFKMRVWIRAHIQLHTNSTLKVNFSNNTSFVIFDECSMIDFGHYLNPSLEIVNMLIR